MAFIPFFLIFFEVHTVYFPRILFYCIVLFRDKKILKYLGGVLYAIIISIYMAIVLNFAFMLPIWLMFVQVLIAEISLASLGILLFYIVRIRVNL